MSEKQQIRERIIQKTLDLAAQMGWESISLQDIASAGELSLAELHDLFEDKADILTALGRMIDRRVLASAAEADMGVSPRDALFDLLMERFEILNEYRPGLTAILRSFKLDPKQAVISMPHLCRSMSWMLEASGIDTNGLRGALKVAGLTGVYLKTLKVWIDDKNPDLSATMAALDKDLAQAEKWANNFGL